MDYRNSRMPRRNDESYPRSWHAWSLYQRVSIQDGNGRFDQVKYDPLSTNLVRAEFVNYAKRMYHLSHAIGR